MDCGKRVDTMKSGCFEVALSVERRPFLGWNGCVESRSRQDGGGVCQFKALATLQAAL